MILLLGLITLIGRSFAFWRMGCSTLTMGRVDPIVSPGQVSAHVHTVVGSSNFGVNSTYESLSSAYCTSCEITADKSAYWTPLLYYEYPNGSVVDVHHTGTLVYYLGRGDNTSLVPFPPGFRMISGSAALRSYDDQTLTWNGQEPIANRVTWLCIDTVIQPQTNNMSYTSCADGLRAQIAFQSCWNGVDLYRSDQSHVAYRSGVDTGDCPPTHPYNMVLIFLETLYAVNNVPQDDGGRFVLSTGDPTGYSFHADFQNGWDQEVQEAAINECAFPDEFGTIETCPILQQHHILNAPTECPFRQSDVNETVQGLLPKLPGCITIVDGPEEAQPSDMNCPASVTRPNIIPTQDSVAVIVDMAVPGEQFGLPDWVYVGCANDSVVSRVLQGTSITNTTGMTVQGCQQYCNSLHYKYAGLEFASQCYCGNFVDSDPVYGNGTQFENQCYYTCPGNISTYCGGSALIDVYNDTAFSVPPPPSFEPSAGLYYSKGCYKDLVNNVRALTGAATANNSMTPELCGEFCSTSGNRFRIFGVEYARECYCGNTFRNEGAAPDGDCNMVCDGSAFQEQWFCGGPARLNIYYAPYVP